jgi:hypothetical protein
LHDFLSFLPVHQMVRTLLGNRRIDMIPYLGNSRNVHSSGEHILLLPTVLPGFSILTLMPIHCTYRPPDRNRRCFSCEIEDSHLSKSEGCWLLKITPCNLVDFYLSVTETWSLIFYPK